MPDNLENRLDRLGAALAGEPVGIPGGSAFLEKVRRRGRVRAVRNSLFAGAGIGLVAAALLLAAMLNPPGVAPEPLDIPRAAVEEGPQAPTIAALSRAAFAAGDLSELPAFPGMSAGPGNAPSVRAGVVHSAELTDELLNGL